MRITTPLTIALLLLPVSIFADAGSTEYGVKKVYRGSSSLPDAVAFSQFLELLEGTYNSQDPNDRDFYFHLLADALGIKAHEDMDLLQDRGELLRKQRQLIVSETRTATKQILSCDSYEMTQRSDDALHATLNSMDDIGNTIREKYLLIAVNSLSGSEQTAFVSYLDELKNNITHIEHDSRIVNDPAVTGRSLQEVRDSICRSLQ